MSLTTKLDLDKCIEELLECKTPSETTVRSMCLKLKELLIDDSNVLHLQAPITVVGDVHG